MFKQLFHHGEEEMELVIEFLEFVIQHGHLIFEDFNPTVSRNNFVGSDADFGEANNLSKRERN